MNRSELIRATSGTPTEIVRTLAAQGIEVTLNLVKQVRKNVERKKRKEAIKYKRPLKPNHGKKAKEIRRLLNLGVTPSQIGKRYGDKARNHAKQIAWRLAHPEFKEKKIFKVRKIKFNVKRLKTVRALDICDTELPDDYNIPVELDRWTVGKTIQIPQTKQHHLATQDGGGDQEQTVVEVRKLVLEDPSQIIKRDWSIGADLSPKESTEAMFRQLDWHQLPRMVAEHFEWFDKASISVKLRADVIEARFDEGVVHKIEAYRQSGKMTPRIALATIIRLLTENLPARFRATVRQPKSQ